MDNSDKIFKCFHSNYNTIAEDIPVSVYYAEKYGNDIIEYHFTIDGVNYISSQNIGAYEYVYTKLKYIGGDPTTILSNKDILKKLQRIIKLNELLK